MSRPSSDATDAAREVSTLYLFPTEGEAAGLRRRRADAAIAVVGVGMAEAAAGTVRALRVWRPRRAVLCGIAGACDGVLHAGDVVEIVEDSVAALPAALADDMERVAGAVPTLVNGVSVGEMRGPKLQPAHALALSAARRADAFPVAELSYAETVAYLRREAVVPPVAGRGYTVVAYQGRALGFVNHLGTRANNLYPPEWRIRSTYGPDAAPEVVLPVDSPKPQYIR